jgi:hypothetical protein
MSEASSNEVRKRELPPARDVLTIGLLFFGAFNFSHNLLMIIQHFRDKIPAGTILKVDYEKSGKHLETDAGEADFPDTVLYRDITHPIVLKAGDTVQKDPDSFSYFVNGKCVADAAWVRQQYLYQPFQIIAFLGFMGMCMRHAIKYHMPWPATAPKPGRDGRIREPKPQFVLYGLILPLIVWILVTLFMMLLFSCVVGCLWLIFIRLLHN